VHIARCLGAAGTTPDPTTIYDLVVEIWAGGIPEGLQGAVPFDYCVTSLKPIFD
jgi:hypothetical protein